MGLSHALARPRRLALTVMGVAAGVALVFATSSIDATLQASISTTLRGPAGNAQLEVSAPPSAAGLSRALVREVGRTRGVAAAVPLTRTTARLGSPARGQRVMVLGVPRDLGRIFDDGLGEAGRQLTGLGRRTLLLGPAALDSNPRAGGQPLRIQVPGGYRRLAAAKPLAAVPFADLNGGAFALTRIDAADSLFGRRGRVDSIYVLAERGASIARLRETLEQRVAGRAFVGRPGSQSLPYERALDSLSQLTDLAVAGSLWVALFVVLNSMSMSLLERRREIALAFALGATRAQLAVALGAEAAIVGFVAALIGIPTGYMLAEALLARSLEAYPLLPLTASGSLVVAPGAVGVALATGPAIAVLGALLPTRRIMGVAPSEALRIEPSLEWSGSRGHAPRRRRNSLLAGGACAAAGTAAAASGTIVAGPWWIGSVAMALILTGALLLLPAVLPVLVRSLRWALRRLYGVLGSLAGDSLLRNPRRTAVTVGVLALTAATAIGLGNALGSFESEMKRSFAGRYGTPLYVTAASYAGVTSDQPLPSSLVRRLKRIEGVDAVYPLRYRPATFEGEQAVIASAPLGRQVRAGLRTALDETRAPSPGRLISGLARGGIVPSELTADRHDLTIGQTVEIPGPDGEMRLRVVGIFDDVLSVDSVYMELATYRRLSGDSSVDHLGISPARGVAVDALESDLERWIAAHHTDAVVQTREEVVDDILANVRGLFGLARGMQLVALLIAAMIVANTMVTVVAERRWELSLTRTLGVTRSQVRGMVLLEALGIGLIGASAALFMGLAIGFLMLTSMELRFSWAIDYRPQWGLMAAIFALGVGGAVAAALLAVRSAARAPIVDSLRSE